MEGKINTLNFENLTVSFIWSDLIFMYTVHTNSKLLVLNNVVTSKCATRRRETRVFGMYCNMRNAKNLSKNLDYCSYSHVMVGQWRSQKIGGRRELTFLASYDFTYSLFVLLKILRKAKMIFVPDLDPLTVPRYQSQKQN